MTTIKKIFYIMIGCVFYAQSSLAFTAGKDYQVLDIKTIPAQMLASKNHPKAIKVVEFFSYGCPWCYKLDPALVAWEKNKPANVEFERVPVIFQPSWLMFVKVFYVATDLGVEARLHSDLFTAIQTAYPEDPQTVSSTSFALLQKADFSTDQGITNYFSQHGVAPQKIAAVLKDHTKLNAQIATALNLTKSLQISEIPTVIIDGKYAISNRNTDGDNKKFIDTLNYLIH